MSHGMATDGVTLFFLEKTNDLFSHLLTTPTFRRRLSSVLSRFIHQKNLISFRCHPLHGVSRGRPLVTPLFSLSLSFRRVYSSEAERLQSAVACISQ